MENLPGDEVLEMGMFEEGYGFYSFECHEISSNVCSVLFCLVLCKEKGNRVCYSPSVSKYRKITD